MRKSFRSQIIILGKTKSIRIPDSFPVGSYLECWGETDVCNAKNISKQVICQCNSDALRNEETGLYVCSRCGQIVDEFRNEVE